MSFFRCSVVSPHFPWGGGRRLVPPYDAELVVLALHCELEKCCGLWENRLVGDDPATVMEVLPHLPCFPTDSLAATSNPPSHRFWAWALPDHEAMLTVLRMFQEQLNNPAWSPSGAYDRADPMVGHPDPSVLLLCMLGSVGGGYLSFTKEPPLIACPLGPSKSRVD